MLFTIYNKKIYNYLYKILCQKGECMEEKLGKIVDDERIYDLDDMESIDKLEALLGKLEKKEADIKRKIDESIEEDLQERE